MRQLHLSPEADLDLENIFRFTYETWGDRQLKKYVHGLEKILLLLMKKSDSPLIRARNELFPGCKSIRFEKHVIFFRDGNGSIEIIRILHEKMDLLRHISGEEE